MISAKSTPEDNDYESWLLPFADMVTFLMAFFVILYSVQQIDPEKAERIKESVSVSLDSEALYDPNATTRPQTTRQKYESITSDIQATLSQSDLDHAVSVHRTRNELMLTVNAEFLFSSGSDQLNEVAVKLIRSIALVIKREPVDIRIEGHTDDVPINTSRFPSNWELSSSRAIAVLKQLEAADIWSTRLSATGYAHTRPLLKAIGTPEEIRAARETNRRVVFVLVRNDWY